MKTLAAAVAAFLAFPQLAQAADFHAEVMEWAIEPCMMVRAALDAEDLDQETIDMGVKLKHVVTLMVAEKDQAARDLVKNMKPDTPWKKRAGGYVAMLRLCLMQTPGLK